MRMLCHCAGASADEQAGADATRSPEQSGGMRAHTRQDRAAVSSPRQKVLNVAIQSLCRSAAEPDATR